MPKHSATDSFSFAASPHAFETIAELFASFHTLETFAAGSILRLDDTMVLLWLAKHTSGSARLLADSLHLARSRVSRMLARLSRSGLVDESVGREDRRSLRFRLSNRGEHVVFELRKRLGAATALRTLDGFCTLQQAGHEACARFGIPELAASSLRILPLLAAAPSALSAKDLIQAACLAPSTVSMALSSLAERGFVVVKTGEDDVRLRSVSLTRVGKPIAQQLCTALVPTAESIG